jgi:hypothetical protein
VHCAPLQTDLLLDASTLHRAAASLSVLRCTLASDLHLHLDPVLRRHPCRSAAVGAYALIVVVCYRSPCAPIPRCCGIIASTSSPSNAYDPMLTAGGTDSIGPSRLHSGEISGLRWFDPLLHDLVIASHLVLEVLILVFPGHNVLLFCVMYDDALEWFLCLGLIMLPSHGWFGSKQMF